jgi:hypothetical protein
MDAELFLVVLAETSIVLTMWYWMSKTMVGGLLSILALFGTGSYWLLMETSFPQIAWVWYAMTLVNLYDFIMRIAYTFGNEIADRYGYRWDFLRRRDEDY